MTDQELLLRLYEDAIASPNFTFRGPALPIVVGALTAARGSAAPAVLERIDALLTFATLTGHVPTDELADVIGELLVDELLDP